ncbi:MAG: C4-dicarboxylate ABC transporter substrate-binding protein [Paracoccus denitrificans]|nr:MAG: C4-dicarboxylate ABC transporter substrate-binding protein [Paracoccus denitrificans]PZO84268.1 MAG: C4-dicarboxylate ABC transporter substrate-binding protein [Paracoccus denitrificans]
MFVSAFKASAAGAMLLMASTAFADVTLTYSEPGPNTGARSKGTEWFVNRVAELSDGAVKVDVSWGGALSSEKAAVQSIEDGVVDMGTVIGVYFPQQMIAYNVADLPQDNADAWVSMKAIDELMRTSEPVKQQLAKQNLVYIGPYTTWTVQLGCKGRDVKSLDQIKGLKVRGVGAYGQIFRDLGATPVSLTAYETFQGLDSGLIECTQTYPYLVPAQKLDEILTSFTMLDIGQIGAVGIFMNKDIYDGLSDTERAALDQAGAELPDAFGQISFKENMAALDMMRAKGISVHDLSAADRQTLHDTAAKYLGEWVGNADKAGLPGQQILDQFNALTAKYAQQVAEKGHPWGSE